MQGIVFLDRDGVINKKAPEHEYITSLSKFEYIPSILEFIKNIKELGWHVCVITNQQGIGKGIMTDSDLQVIHDKIQSDLFIIGTNIDGFYYCPHLKSDKCGCRKPKTGLLEEATKDLNFFDSSRMIFLGDSDGDMEAAQAFGIRGIRVPCDRTFEIYDEVIGILRSIDSPSGNKK